MARREPSAKKIKELVEPSTVIIFAFLDDEERWVIRNRKDRVHFK